MRAEALENGKRSAFPSENHPYGLTKREVFALVILHALLLRGERDTHEAVAGADHLLEALEKGH